MKIQAISRNRFGFILGFLFVYLVAFKFIAATQMDLLGDEPDDVHIIVSDLQNIHNFFEQSYEHDQARLPHLVALPFVCVLKDKALIPVRIVFILLHLVFLIVFYQTMRLKFPGLQAFYCTVLVSLNTYLASFSVFTMTTSNNLYLLFGMASIYFYLKHFDDVAHRNTPSHFVILSLLLGLCTASKLFGIFILISIFIYDSIRHFHKPFKSGKQKARITTTLLFAVNTVFTLSVTITHFLPIKPILKLETAVLLAFLFIIGSLAILAKERGKALSVGFIAKWFLVVHACFNFTITFSPNYLNYQNILAIFSWYEKWNASDFVINPSRMDIFNIIFVKLGLVGVMLLVLALVLLVIQQQLGDFIKRSSLFLILFVAHMAFLLIPRFALTWYPIFVFHLLLIPLSTLVDSLARIKNRYIYAILLLVCLVYPALEHSRYYRFFPYGHVDGIQYGEAAIGWSKPGFISFEGIPLCYEYLDAHRESIPPGVVGCNLVHSDFYNRWAVYLLNYFFQVRGFHAYKFSPANYLEGEPPYYLTSVYTPERDRQVISKKYTRVANFDLCNVSVGAFWEFKER